MKKLVLIVVLILGFISCKNKSNISDTFNSESENIEFVKILSDKILTEQKQGRFYNLSEEEANLIMINGLSESVQKAAYKEIKRLFGDYKSLEFESLVEINKVEKYQVYRFKGVFEFNSNVEIRTVIDANGKLAGFFVKPWKDTL